MHSGNPIIRAVIWIPGVSTRITSFRAWAFSIRVQDLAQRSVLFIEYFYIPRVRVSAIIIKFAEKRKLRASEK